MKWNPLLLLTTTVAAAACSPSTSNNPPASQTTVQTPDKALIHALKNATYELDGQRVTLVDGIAESQLAPGSASKEVTRFFGNELEVDLNGDGRKDAAFLLEQQSGGSGTFYFVAAALRTVKGYKGINGIFLGDRIAPQATLVDHDRPSQFIVSYADRDEKQTFSDEPTLMVSKTFKLDGTKLVEVASVEIASP